MYRTELERLRSLMGQSIQGWSTEPSAVGEVGDGYWAVLSGAPSPDVNLALVWSPAPDALRRPLDLIEQIGAPALLNIAGDAAVQTIGDEWQQIGTMPFMAVDVGATPTAADPRVRRAGPADLATVVGLLAESYAMAPEIASVAVRPVVERTDADAGIRFWLLEDDGVAVSTVMTGQVDDIVSVWCMGTPGRFARRGYARAILAHALDHASREDAELGLLGATPAGKPLYENTGWQTLEEWQIYVNAKGL